MRSSSQRYPWNSWIFWAFEILVHSYILTQLNVLGQDGSLGSFLPHTILILSPPLPVHNNKKGKLKRQEQKRIVQANQFCSGSRREQISSTPTVKTGFERAETSRRLWLVPLNCCRVVHCATEQSQTHQRPVACSGAEERKCSP